MSFQDFFICGQHYWFRDINTLDLTNLTNSNQQQKMSELARDLFILMDPVIICIHFGSNQPPVSLKITTATSLLKETLAITPTNLLKQDFTYSSNASWGPFCADFCCRKGISCLILKWSLKKHESKYKVCNLGLSYLFK